MSDATGYTLSPWQAPAPSLAPGFELRLHLDVPRLEWRPVRPRVPFSGLKPLSDPPAALEATERHILGGSLLFGMQSPSWPTLDMAFLRAPTLPSPLFPSSGEIKALLDDSAWAGPCRCCRRPTNPNPTS
jgi:hypothetical protein